MEEPLAFVLAALALTGSPGPANLSLAAVGAAFGARRALGYQAGLVLGVLIVLAIAASGVIGLVLALPGAATVITVVAAAYIVYLAYRIATAPPPAEALHDARPPSLGSGLLLNLVNPKSYAAMAALLSGFVLDAGHPVIDAAAKAAILFVIIAGVTSAWLLGGGLLSRLAQSPRVRRTINIGFAGFLVLSVGFALLL